MSAAIVVEALHVTYPTQTGATLALLDCTFHAAAGEFIALVGPSGCGKTTLLRVLGGLLAPSRGTVALGGLAPTQARRTRQISIVFQQPALLPWMQVRDNVDLPLRLAGVPLGKRRAVAERLLALVGLAHVATAYPHQLSGGMAQRVALARALSYAPEVLLLDEPFAALDELTRERLNMVLLDLWTNTPATVIFVTHAIEEAALLADRVLVMAANPGRVIAEVVVPLPRPRTIEMLEQPRFLATLMQLRHLLRTGDTTWVPPTHEVA